MLKKTVKPIQTPTLTRWDSYQVRVGLESPRVTCDNHYKLYHRLQTALFPKYDTFLQFYFNIQNTDPALRMRP